MRNVSQYNTSYGQVKIIPASTIRNDPQFLQSQQAPHTSGGPPPAAGPYYMGYAHEPYGENAYVDQYSDGYPVHYGRMPHYYPGYSYTPSAYPGAYGPYPGQSTAYRAYPQPSPPHRRSRTAPARTLTRPVSSSHVVYPAPPPPTRQKTRGYSADPLERGRQFHEFSGPSKRPQPLYRKRREVPTRNGTSYQETDFGGGPIDYTATFGRPYTHQQHYPTAAHQQEDPRLRRLRPYYAPSYTTYPPSTMHRTKRKEQPHKYPLFARMALKMAQLILGAAILGLVLGPMRNNSFHDFVIRTKTEWQGLVVGSTAIFCILTLLFLVSSPCVANTSHFWRKLDAHLAWTGAFMYFLCGFVEAYFAACYPPNGPKINLVCHRAEWIIATILLFINVVLYVIDFVMIWMSGVSML